MRVFLYGSFHLPYLRPKSKVKFSLIMATLGRTNEVERFLSCLDAQTYRCFELIVVDQNPDDRILPFLQPYRTLFPIFHLYSEKGTSRARNVGLEHVKGDVVGFPDDDCWYPPDLLERVSEYLRERSDLHGITGRVTDWEGTFDARFDRSSGLLNRPTLGSERLLSACSFVIQ